MRFRDAHPTNRPPDRVTDGPLEPMGVGYRTWANRPTFLQALFGGQNWESVTRERWGRKRFEYWDGPKFVIEGDVPAALSVEDGEVVPASTSFVVRAVAPETYGRWYWVPEPRYRPEGAPPLPPTCARDSLEDEFGYETALAMVGARDCLAGFPLVD